MKECEISDLNERQLEALEVLIDIGGWATSGQLKYHGVNHSSANALVERGFAEKRIVQESFYGISEWRILIDRLPDLTSIISENSVFGMLIKSNLVIYSMANKMLKDQANAILDSANPDVKH